MKIVKHCTSAFPTTATGAIVGMDKNSLLEITNCFPFPTSDVPQSDSHNQNDHNSASNAAAAAPRAKSNIAYQAAMINQLREVNVDANNVGWYTSANMGNFINMSLIENQYYYQKEVNERTVCLVHDVSRSAQGAMSLRAFRLSPTFMAAYKDGVAKFTTENLQKSKLSYKDILVELPLNVHNSHLMTSFLHQLPSKPVADLEFPHSLAELNATAPPNPLYPSYETTFDMSIDPFLEKSCDLLLDAVESHYTELNNFQYAELIMEACRTFTNKWQVLPETDGPRAGQGYCLADKEKG